MLANIVDAVKKEWILCAIITAAFLLRIVGIGYGLPLPVVNDEYPFTYAALQMIQAKTIVPALHPAVFQNILPYPPYISYLLLVPFIGIIGIKFLLFSGSREVFEALLLSDLSLFFETARVLNVVIGTLSVYLTYMIAMRVFRSRVAALTAAFLLGTSILHVALSMVGRNWIDISFVYLCVLFALTSQADLGRRYMWSFIVAGIGMGISSLSIFSLVMAGIYYLCFDMAGLQTIRRDFPRMAYSALIFAALATIPYLLWHGGNAFIGNATYAWHKTLVALFMSPWSALSLVAFSEPIFVAALIAGLILLVMEHRKFFYFVSLWSLFYFFLFYLAFRFDARFQLPLMPLFAIIGGYGISRIWNSRTSLVLGLLLLVPLVCSLRVSYLALEGDTREHAAVWILGNLKPDDKILVYSSALHITTSAAAVKELREIDASALRKVDTADEVLDRQNVPYVLNNLTSITNKDLIHSLASYAQAKRYKYLLLEPRSLIGFPEMARQIEKLTSDAVVVQRFSGFDNTLSIYNSAFLESFTHLFWPKSFGPDIVIYQLK